MAVLFALGVMSLVWMALLAGVLVAQKLLPGGRRSRWALAGLLVALGIWVAAAPAGVPGLVEPMDGGMMDGGMMAP